VYFTYGTPETYRPGPTIFAGWVVGGIILTDRVPAQDRMRIADFGYGPVNTIALAVAVLLVLLVVMLVRRRPGPTAP
jgi:hypothetical protein